MSISFSSGRSRLSCWSPPVPRRSSRRPWRSRCPRRAVPAATPRSPIRPNTRPSRSGFPAHPVVSYRDLPPVVEHYARQVLATPARVEHETIAPVYRTTWRWIEVPGPRPPDVLAADLSHDNRAPTDRARASGVASRRRRPRIRRGRSLRPRRRLAGASDRRGALPRACTRPLYCRSPPRAGFARPPFHDTGRATPRQGSRSRSGSARPHGRARHPGDLPHDRRRPHHPPRRAASGSSVPDRCGSSLTAYWPARRNTAGRRSSARHTSARLIMRRCDRCPRRSTGPQSYGPAPVPASGYGGTGGYGAAPVQHVGHAYRPDEILAPTPTYPATDAPTLVPAPYDVGHPARRLAHRSDG